MVVDGGVEVVSHHRVHVQPQDLEELHDDEHFQFYIVVAENSNVMRLATMHPLSFWFLHTLIYLMAFGRLHFPLYN